MVAKEDVSKEDLDKATEETLTSAQKIGEAMQKAQAEKAKAGESQSEAADASSEKSSDDSDDKKDAQEGEVIKE